MYKLLLIFCIAVLMGCKNTYTPTQNSSFYPDIKNIRMVNGLLSEQLKTVNEITIPHCIDKCIEMGIVENFSRAAGLTKGDYIGLTNSDEFLYKTIEAASYSLISDYNLKIDERLDSIIAIIAAAQEPDGYLRTPQTIYWLRNGVTKRNPRWSKLNGDLELYCSGHLIEAAVAHHSATGKTSLLDVAKKNAELICQLFGKDKKYQGVDMIPEIELALIRLYDLTLEKKYLFQAKYFLEERGDSTNRKLMGPFSLDHKPLKEQKEAVGHATFAAYLYSAAADLVNLKVDEGYREPVKNLWNDIVHTKMSINGGIGSRHDNEGFGDAFDLPDLTAYNEICAAVAFCNLNKRMFQMEQHSQYFDVLEHTLYNNLLSGLSQDGKEFFYICPTESKSDYKFNLGWCPDYYTGPYKEAMATRKSWLPCACCPPTLSRFMASLPSLIFATTNNKIYANLYAESNTELLVNGQNVQVKEITDYPWDGNVMFHFYSSQPFHGQLLLRIPSWLDKTPIYGDLYSYADSANGFYEIYVMGKPLLNAIVENGYAKVELNFKDTCSVYLTLNFKARKIQANEKLADHQSQYAFQRGPILYCFEERDNLDVWNALMEKKTSEIYEYTYDEDLLNGHIISHKLVNNGQHIKLKSIPYYLWSNRGENNMKVWVK